MSKFTELYEKIDGPVKFWGLVFGLIGTAYTATLSFLTSLINPNYLLLTQCLIGYLILLVAGLLLCRYVLNATETKTIVLASGTGSFQEPRFSVKYRRLARRGRIALLLGLAVFALLFFLAIRRTTERCDLEIQKLSITINKFSPARDEFSDNLKNYLNIHIDRSASVDFTNRYFSPGSRDGLKDSLVSLLHCHTSGIIVYGNNNWAEKSFYCNICLHNMINTCARVRIRDTIIPIQDPKLIEIENTTLRAQIIGEFIQSVYLSYRCRETQSTALINRIITDDANQACKQLMAYCYLIKGNNQARSQHIDSAIRSYETGLTFEKENTELNANLKLLASSYERYLAAKAKKEANILQVPNKSLPVIKHKRPPNAFTPAVFTGGTMKVSYQGSLENFNHLRFERDFTMRGGIYKFQGLKQAHVAKDSVNKYSYTFELKPNPVEVDAAFNKNDFKNAQCDFRVYDKKSQLVTDMAVTVEIVLYFSDKSSLVFNKNNISFH